ncbi:WG repeat-containing protein [uncultured Microscilla sp.]|uniref:WG repeat-containing protein n=1 Tax=uncultured Microscilla sp. TaxID=432653 RepID=UPI0026398285|nr:WG repeat-containing protein [uncultured Microscilla sp.]
MKLYTTEQCMLLNGQPLGSGAEGNVYEVVAPAAFKNYVAKVYHRHEQHKHRVSKIKHLITARANSNISSAVILPKECLYNEEGDFVGFLMPRVNAPYHLTSLCSLSLPHNAPEAWHNKYARVPYNLYFRLLICKNLAEVVASLHQTSQYVFADLKPENIKVNLNGDVFIIDVDSIQVTQDQALLFATEKITPEYAPQEVKHIHFKHEIVPVHWDHFSLGVIFYKVLLGLHPYTGTCLPPYEDLVSNEQKIQANLLPLGDQAQHFDIIPEPHQAFGQLPPLVQQLLEASFSVIPSQRPDALCWQQTLEKELKVLGKPKIKKQAIVITGKLASVARTHPVDVPSKPSKAHRDVAKLIAVNITAFMILMALVRFVSASNLFKQTASVSPLVVTPLNSTVASKKTTYSSHRVLHRQSQKYGLVDRRGKVLLPYDYDWIGNFSEGLASIVLRTKTGYVNADGKVTIPLVYDEGWAFRYGFARVSIRQKMAMINQQGKLLVPLYYDGVWNFDLPAKGLARVERQGKYGFINQQGKEVIGLWFDWADDFAGRATTKAKIKGEIYIINRLGKVLGRARHLK